MAKAAPDGGSLLATPVRVLELFAGAGGMALGNHRAGFRTVALLENQRHAVKTLRYNSETGAGVTCEIDVAPVDVTQIEYERFSGPIDYLSAGTPCQPFSLGGKHKGHRDTRNLFPEVFRAQRTLAPKAVLIENVRGLVRSNFRSYLEYVLLQFAMPGLLPRGDERQHKEQLLRAFSTRQMEAGPTYNVWIRALDCADYGVPQRRVRVFIIALRTDLGLSWTWPQPTHSRAALVHAQQVTGVYWRRHGLMVPPQPRKRELASLATPEPKLSSWRTVRDALAGVPNPWLGRPHPFHRNHVGIPGARSYRGHTGSPLDQPAKTLKAGVHGVPGGENMLRNKDGSVRYFTVHEAALLQTFPPEYVFCGSRTEAMRQIGNAAPVQVIELLATQIRRVLDRSEVGSESPPKHIDLVDVEPKLI